MGFFKRLIEARQASTNRKVATILHQAKFSHLPYHLVYKAVIERKLETLR